MRLRAWDLTIERGGRRVIGGLSFEAPAGFGLIVTGPNGAGKTSLLRALAGFLPIDAGGFALDGGDSERTVGEQAHYLGHADGVKGSADRGREPRLRGRDAGRRFLSRARSSRRLRRSA